MNPFASIISNFYSVERKTSIGQLRDDFGHFPPTPLLCESLTGEFSVVRIRGVGEIYQTVALPMQLLDTDAKELSSDLLSLLDPAELERLQIAINSIGPRGKILAKRLVFCYLFIVESVRAMRYGAKRPNVRGYFMPALKAESRVFIRVGGLHLNKSDAAILSHEHIHLLQHKEGGCHAKNLRSPETLVSESGLAKPFLLYVLQKDEVEARLHELVLSFYRSHNELPVTLPKFIGMLVASQQLGEYARSLLNDSNVCFEQEMHLYPDRESALVADLESILVYSKSFELARRFLTEVLPVMYGNLLRYYGDEVTSQRFLNTVERPNLYDELYGLGP